MDKPMNLTYQTAIWLAVIIFPFHIFGQDDSPARILPSVVLLNVQKIDGSIRNEIGFLTIRDGIVATAFDVVRDARRVTARFSGGDEYECTGIIDKDETRNVAIVRIKVFGKPILKMTANDLAAGKPLNAAAIKDSAFGIVRVIPAEAVAPDGTKLVRLDGDILPNNNGSPVLDEEGNVVGILTLKKVGEKIGGYLIRSGFILALDNSLPTKPWDQTANSNPALSPDAAERMNNRQAPDKPNLSNDEIDKLIGKALRELVDNRTVYEYSYVAYAGAIIGAPSEFYEKQLSLGLAYSKLNDARTSDPLRSKLASSILPILKNQLESSETFIKALTMAQQLQTYAGQPADVLKRSLAQQKIIASMLEGLVSDLLALEKDSAVLMEFMPPELRLFLGLMPASSGIRMNILNSVANPFYLLYVYPGGLAEKIGLKRGDKIISVAGKTFTDNDCIEDLRVIIKQNLGKKLDAVVEREGKVISLKLTIPAILPENAIIK